MALDYREWEKVRQIVGGGACGPVSGLCRQDADQHGNHLRIDAAGRFCCVIHPGKAGVWHRKEIFRRAGAKRREPAVPVKVIWRLKR